MSEGFLKSHMYRRHQESIRHGQESVKPDRESVEHDCWATRELAVAKSTIQRLTEELERLRAEFRLTQQRLQDEMSHREALEGIVCISVSFNMCVGVYVTAGRHRDGGCVCDTR